jgi:hypothetical protein
MFYMLLSFHTAPFGQVLLGEEYKYDAYHM